MLNTILHTDVHYIINPTTDRCYHYPASFTGEETDTLGLTNLSTVTTGKQI